MTTKSQDLPAHVASKKWLWLSFFCFLFIAVYGSLVPLNYRQLSFSQAVERFSNIPFLYLDLAHRADWVANILLFMPLGFFGTAVLTDDQDRIPRTFLKASLVVLVCFILSVSIEFTQLWFPPRTVSQNDIVAESIGSLVGSLLWVFAGKDLAAWIKRYFNERDPAGQLYWLLTSFVVGFFLYAAMPLDLTINPRELFQKYKEGKFVLVPFSEIQWELWSIYAIVRDIFLFSIVGVWAAWQKTSISVNRSMVECCVIGWAFVLATEIMQVFVYTRFFSTTDLILGAIGVLLGVVMVKSWLPSLPNSTTTVAQSHCKKWFYLALCFALFLLLWFCFPASTIGDNEQIKTRFHSMFRPPFSALYWGSEFNALRQILFKVLLFVPLGAFVSIGVCKLNAPCRIANIIYLLTCLFFAVFAIAIEILQIFLLEHTPDMTDSLFYFSGAMSGLLITNRLMKSRNNILIQ